jgi:hypothetical protein
MYPSDIKALGSLAWANGSSESNFIGGRCDVKETRAYPNGRLIQQRCFDNNPATFHLALGNMIGKQKLAFAMDKTFDYEVWNQPVKSYEFTYFNPKDPSKRSKNWKDVAVDYDEDFKKGDRFQNPRTRGIRSIYGYGDTEIKKIVGVIAVVTYLGEVDPVPSAGAQEDDEVRTNWVYDLELQEKNGKLIPMGGEWHQNSHPDFLWVPKKRSFAAGSSDYVDVDYTGHSKPSARLTSLAQDSSGDGSPLCRVVKELFRQSSGKDDYLCPE